MSEKTKKRDPWTDPDPQPGDFDEYLDEMEEVEVIFDPDLEIRLVSDEELARRVGPAQAKRLGLVGVEATAERPKPAER
ncbi:MAG TPA: hypothetical protein VHS74_16740 [Solirubrobacterales bacterium]|jgi:hypothetical protein|nr:hypothetical protein [Solirubrobacterales bacterium]